MVRLTLPAYLLALVPEEARRGSGAPRSVWLQPGPWGDLTREIQERFPLLATRVLRDSASLTSGFALVVNDEVVPGGHPPTALRSGDEIVLLAAVAGG